MWGVTLKVCRCRVFTYLVLFSFLTLASAVSFDLTELRNKVAKIKVNPRGNLWATGHFMGKKSVMDTPVLQSPEGQGAEALLAPVPVELGDLFQEVLRATLRAQVDTQESRSKNQETELLMKILESYIQNNRK